MLREHTGRLTGKGKRKWVKPAFEMSTCTHALSRQVRVDTTVGQCRHSMRPPPDMPTIISTPLKILSKKALPRMRYVCVCRTSAGSTSTGTPTGCSSMKRKLAQEDWLEGVADIHQIACHRSHQRIHVFHLQPHTAIELSRRRTNVATGLNCANWRKLLKKT